METKCTKEELKKEELRTLRRALIQLMDFIRHSEWEDEPYFYRSLDNMKNNIEIYFYTHSGEEEQLHKLLVRDWEAANDCCIGIPSCELAAEQENKQGLNRRYIELLEQVGRFFL